MPELILEIAALDYVFPAPARRCVLGPDGGTLGRDERNTLVLPDRFRRVSRLHAEVTFVRGVPILSNRSSTLVVNVGEQEVAPGESAIVQDDDVIEVGPYLLNARVHDERRSLTAPAAVAPAVARAPATAETLEQAFLEGARMPADTLRAGFTAENAELIGAMLRYAVQGTMDLLAARTITQREVRVGTALISEQSNNPLLFLPGADAALVQLLTGQLPGFMHGTRAMPDAFADLLAHESGVMAGMRAALAEMLSRLDPRQADISLHGTQDASSQIVASAVKARWWDSQTARFDQLLVATEDNFQEAWGRVFVDAYSHAAESTRTQALAIMQSSGNSLLDDLPDLTDQSGSRDAAMRGGDWKTANSMRDESCLAL
jgi:predicted component of type VI protein secretion system